MWFGQGPRHDYAYDGDVVYHEFTHAVVDATIQLPSAINAPGAMNEGLRLRLSICGRSTRSRGTMLLPCEPMAAQRNS